MDADNWSVAALLTTGNVPKHDGKCSSVETDFIPQMEHYTASLGPTNSSPLPAARGPAHGPAHDDLRPVSPGDLCKYLLMCVAGPVVQVEKCFFFISCSVLGVKSDDVYRIFCLRDRRQSSLEPWSFWTGPRLNQN